MAGRRKTKTAPAPPAPVPPRPRTACTLALTLQFCDELRRSYHIATTCRRLGLSRHTVNDWIDKGDKVLSARAAAAEAGEPEPALTEGEQCWLEFAQRTAQTRAEIEQELLGYVRTAAEPLRFEFDAKGKPFRVVRSEQYAEDRLSGDWRAALELLKVMRPDVYGDRQTVTHEGGLKVQQSLDVPAVVNNAEASVAAAALLAAVANRARPGTDDAGGAGEAPGDVSVPPGPASGPAQPGAPAPGSGADAAPDGDDAAQTREE